MANKILVIGVGSAGVIAADKMDIPNSKKIFIGATCETMSKVKSNGAQIPLTSAICYPNSPNFLRERAIEHIEEIRECIKNAFED